MSNRFRMVPALAREFAVVFALCVIGAIAQRPASADSPPNVIIILSDDHAWTDYGFMGHEAIRTPHIDRLARESAVFTRGYVPASLCRASLMTAITGQYPHEHKVTGNDPPKGTDRRVMLKHVAAAPTLPRLLAPLGYRSLQTGKWWEGSYQEGGFTDGMTHGDPSRGGRHGDEGLKIGRAGLAPIFKFIESGGSKPFFLWYAPMMPHTPHNPPERLLEKYTAPGRSPFVARYYAMCEWFDETCGELLDYLDEKKLADNTIVVYLADNGWIQNPDSGNFAPRSKRSPNEGGIRTPIMIRWPGKIQPARDEKTLAGSIDVAPTILAACELPVPRSLPGVNLLDLAAGRTPPRQAMYGEIFSHDVAQIDNPAASLQYRWCIEGSWKLILPVGTAGGELYDLASDPHEKNDLAERHPDVVRRLTKRLDDWWTPQS
jgi:arylsulfatase A-like enzyme